MKTIKSILKTIGLIIAFSLTVLIIFSFTSIIVSFVAAILGLMFLAWACGAKITVSSNGVPIGYIRWTKFHPY